MIQWNCMSLIDPVCVVGGDFLFYCVCTTILTVLLIIMFFNSSLYFINSRAFPFIISYFCYVYMIFLVY